MAQPYEPVDGSASPRRKRILVALAATAVLFVGAVAVYGTPSTTLEDFKKDKEKMWAPELEKQYRECATAQRYRNEHVKAVHDSPVASLFEYSTLKGEAKFEASDVVRIGEHFYSICDSSWAVLRVHESLPMRSKLNAHMGDPQHGFAEGESGFEGIFHDKTQDGMYVVREAVDISGEYADDTNRRRLGLPPVTDHPKYHAIVMQILLPPPDSEDTDYAVLDSCPSEMLFDGDSKGFEGARSIRGADGVLYVLGLCEGNHCSSQTGKDVGHGKVIVMAREDEGGPTGGCYWKTVRTIDLPMKEFVDYSALAIHHRTKAVAITSQENSQVWVGELSTGSDGEFDPMTAEFSKGKVYDFPRAATCAVQYCNIEGIEWVDDGGADEDAPRTLVGVSDKMKGKGKQPFTCLEKDQSFHLFQLP
jgi:hypothetical protein